MTDFLSDSLKGRLLFALPKKWARSEARSACARS